MKKLIVSLILAILTTSSVLAGFPVPDATNANDAVNKGQLGSLGAARMKLYIFGGQSNMLGSSGEGAGEFDFENDRVKYWYHLRSSTDTLIGESSALTNLYMYPTYWGPELAAGQALSENTDNVCIIRVAKSGGTMHTDFLPPSGYMYQEITNAVLLAKAELEADGYVVDIERLCWLQGESDAASLDNSTNHLSRFTTMVDQLETDFGISDLPVTIALINDRRQTSTRPFINAGYKRYCGPNDYYFRTTDVEMKVDYNHYVANGLHEIGRRFVNTRENFGTVGSTVTVDGEYYKLSSKYGETLAITNGLTHWLSFDGLSAEDIVGSLAPTANGDGAVWSGGGFLTETGETNYYHSTEPLVTGTVFSVRAIVNINESGSSTFLHHYDGAIGSGFQMVMGAPAGSPSVTDSEYGLRVGSAYKNVVGLDKDDLGNNKVDMVFTTDGTTYNLYMNGDLISSDTTTPPDIDAGSDFYIGSFVSGGAPSNNAEGYVYDLQSYDRELTANEIKFLHSKITTTEAEPVLP